MHQSTVLMPEVNHTLQIEYLRLLHAVVDERTADRPRGGTQTWPVVHRQGTDTPETLSRVPEL
jgi:hypothetical protein